MSGPSQRATGPTGQPKRKQNTIDLPTARQMLPLVQSIVKDLVDTRSKLTHLSGEQDVLDRERRSLTWESRQRRYSVADELNTASKAYTAALGELTQLGVSLVDDAAGSVEFPTRINGRPAAFSWQMGEDGVRYWRYAGEEQRRPIPTDWQQGTALRSRAESSGDL
jgi:hypothetical protein